MNLRTPRGQSPLERWAHHVAQGIVVAGVIAVSTALWQMNGNVERILWEIKRIKSDVADHEERIRDIEQEPNYRLPSRRSPSENFPR